MRKAAFLLFVVFSFVSCDSNSKKGFVRYSYDCCDSTCTLEEHVLQKEFFNGEGVIQNSVEYQIETRLPFRFVNYLYDGKRISFITDSSQYVRDRIQFTYDTEGKLQSKVTYHSWLTVVNEIEDTIPHTQWQWQVDTIFQAYHYAGNRITSIVELQQGDTLSNLKYHYDTKDRLLEVSDVTTKRKLFYNSIDSLTREEKWIWSNASSDVTDYDARKARWRMITVVERTYDSLNRRATQVMTDEAIGHVLESLKYDHASKGRLSQIRSEIGCIRFIYNRE